MDHAAYVLLMVSHALRLAIAAVILAGCASKPPSKPPSKPDEPLTPVARPREAEQPPAPELPTPALYAELFAKGVCFRYRAVHREQSWEEDGPQTKDESKVAEIRCCVAEVRRFALGTAASVRCTWPLGWSERDLVGNPPIDPVIPPNRAYVATPHGLWWTTDMPASDADVKRVLDDPQRQLVALSATELRDDNTEDEDVSYTAIAERDSEGRWCWEWTERDDYKITEVLCFANGTIAHSLRLHDVDDDLDTTTLDLIE
jgi:hypothetical protein